MLFSSNNSTGHPVITVQRLGAQFIISSNHNCPFASSVFRAFFLARTLDSQPLFATHSRQSISCVFSGPLFTSLTAFHEFPIFTASITNKRRCLWPPPFPIRFRAPPYDWERDMADRVRGDPLTRARPPISWPRRCPYASGPVKPFTQHTDLILRVMAPCIYPTKHHREALPALRGYTMHRNLGTGSA